MERIVTTRKSQVSTRTQIQTETKLREAGLNDLEERALRMLHGIAIADNEPLEFRGEDNPDVSASLEAIEKRALQHLMGTADARRKQAIIDQLRDI